jgi:hypothetical protein
MTSELLASIAGIVLSLGFSYIPGLSVWYAKLDGIYKRLLMAGLLLLTAAAAFGLSCADIFATVKCSQDGVIGLVEVFVLALIANQSTYLITPESKAVSEAKFDSWAARAEADIPQ